MAGSLVDETIGSSEQARFIAQAVKDARIEALGREVVARRGTPDSYLESEEARLTRDTVRQFARAEVAPIAEHIHRHDDLVPESLIGKMGELGFFGMAVPEEYGGGGMGNLAMIVTTEELSAASLAAAGSLITRPEILTKALLEGRHRGSRSSSGCRRSPPARSWSAISVTEPDTGSDVASVKCRAEPAERDGKTG